MYSSNYGPELWVGGWSVYAVSWLRNTKSKHLNLQRISLTINRSQRGRSDLVPSFYSVSLGR